MSLGAVGRGVIQHKGAQWFQVWLPDRGQDLFLRVDFCEMSPDMA